MGFFKDMKNAVQAAQQVNQQYAAHYAQHGYDTPAPDFVGQSVNQGKVDPTRFMPPPSEFVKRQTCVFCGAPKQLPSVREYLYCDFCGQLLDFDLRVAAASAFNNPDSVQYAQAANQAGPMAQQALDAGDRARYLQLQTYLYEMQATYTRWVTPPRAWNDQGYRAAWIRFNAEQMTAIMFDPEYKRLDGEMRRLSMSLKWQGGNMLQMATQAMGGPASPNAFPKVELSSFWPLVEVLLAQSMRQKQVVDASGLRAIDPDQSNDVLSDRMLRSGICQGWLKYLDPEPGQELISRLGISHEYFRPEVVADKKGCGGCGGTMHVAPGAKVVVCDGCGLKLDLGAGDMECTGCGGHIAIPDGQPTAQCPFCKAEVRRM